MVVAGVPATFDASGSTGSGLTYRIEFGDGAEATLPVASYAPQARDWSYQLTAKLTVTDTLGRTDVASVPFTLVSLRSPSGGFWEQREPGVTPAERRIWLVQTGPTLSGLYRGPESGDPRTDLQVTGTVVGDRKVNLTVAGGLVELTGTVEWRSGGWDGVEMRLEVKGGSANGQTLKFVAYEPF
jgi:hypothetical protein